MAFKGIFWIKPPCELIALKVKCDFCGNLLDDIPCDMLSKSGGNFNHKNAWNILPKSTTDGEPFNYYPPPRQSRNQKRKSDCFYKLSDGGIKAKNYKLFLSFPR